MYKRLSVLILLCCLLGCDLAEDTQNTAQDGAVGAVKQIDKSKVLSDLTQVTGELQTYHMQHEKYPDSLDELKLKLYHPEDLDYDPKTGQVHSKTYPKL